MDYMILNPSPFLARTAEGHILMLAHVDRPGYLSIAHFEDLRDRGLITIHSMGGNNLAEQYGRVQVAYTIND